MKTLYNSRLFLLVFSMITAFSYNSNATKHIVTVQNFAFTPSSMTVNLGDTVEWTFVNGSHTTTSTTIPIGATAWNNPIDGAHLKFDYVPAVTGTYNYHCNIHPTTMIASFTVVCPTPSISISASGPTTFCKPGSVTLAISSSSGGPFTSFQWKKGNSNVAGATNAAFTATGSGAYKLVATNGCGNSATSNSISVTANPKPGADFTQGPCTGGAVLLTRTGTPTTGVAFQWKKGNTNIPGATNSTFSATVTASYKVKVTIVATGCTKTSPGHMVNVNCKLGEVNTEVTAYPNPSVDYFVLNTSSLLDQVAYVNVYDITGKLLERQKVTAASIETGKNLAAGFYVAKIEVNGEFKQILKLVKNQ